VGGRRRRLGEPGESRRLSQRLEVELEQLGIERPVELELRSTFGGESVLGLVPEPVA
jgi:hypothetical protein